MIKKVEFYKTEDGLLFDTRRKAEEHERQEELNKVLAIEYVKEKLNLVSLDTLRRILQDSPLTKELLQVKDIERWSSQAIYDILKLIKSEDIQVNSTFRPTRLPRQYTQKT